MNLVYDLSLVCRSLRRRPLFFAQCIVTLGVGLGCVSALLFLVGSTVERHLSAPADVHLIAARSSNGALVTALWGSQLTAFRDREDVLADIAASSFTNVAITRNDLVVAGGLMDVTAGLLPLLGARMEVGRYWGDSSGQPTQGLLISDDLCRRVFGRPDIALGQSLSIGSSQLPIIGVVGGTSRLPRLFRGDVFRLLGRDAAQNHAWDLPLLIVGKLRPGLPAIVAADRLQQTPVAGTEAQQTMLRSNSIVLLPLAKLDDFEHPEVFRLLAIAGILLYVCATFNAASLVVVRTIDRRMELSVRWALGATSAHVYRIFVLESLILVLGGTLLGVAIAVLVTPVFVVAAGADVEVSLDGSLAGLLTTMVLILASVTAAVMAWLPSRVSHRDYGPGSAVRAGGIGVSKQLSKVRSALVVIQTTLAVVLLGTASLVYTAVHGLMNVDIGFKTPQRLEARIDFEGQQPSDDVLNARLRDLRYQLEHVPGAISVGLASDALLAGHDSSWLMIDRAGGDSATAAATYILGDYGPAAGVALRAGRWAAADSRSEVVVNAVFAEREWPRQNPLGQFVKPRGTPPSWPGWRVVGVTDSVRVDVHQEPTPRIFLPGSWSPQTIRAIFVLVDGPIETARFSIEQVLRQTGTSARLVALSPLRDLRAAQLGPERNAMHVLNSLAVSAMILVFVGTYTLLAQLVQVRSREFGVRMALGASPRRVVWMVVSQGVALAVAGLALGFVLLTAFVKLLRFMMPSVPQWDATSLLFTAFVVLVAILLAAAGPSFRASRIDPAQLLRTL